MKPTDAPGKSQADWSRELGQAVANLRQVPLRTCLTVAGVMIGVGTLVCMFAFGLGIQRLSVEEFQRYNLLNAIQVTSAQVGFPRRHRERPAKPAPVLDEAALARIARIPGVISVTPVVQFPVELVRGDRRQTAFGRSFKAGLDERNKLLQLCQGRFCRAGGGRELIITRDALDNLGLTDPAKALDLQLTLAFFSPEGGATAQLPGLPSFALRKQELDFRIVGVLEVPRGGFDNPLLRSDILLPLETVKELGLHRLAAIQGILQNPGRGEGYTLVEVRTGRSTDGPRVEKDIQKLGFRTFSLNSMLGEMNRVFIVMDAALGAVGSVALLVACLGIVNTLFIAVLERRREIGIMKAVGARRKDIRRLFLVEGSLIGLLGGLLGIVLGYSVARVINFFLNLYIESQGARPADLFHFPPWLLLAAIGFSVAVSVLSAISPAARAARLDPVDSLRFE